MRERASGTETDQYIRAGAAEWRRSRILYAPVLFIWKWMQAIVCWQSRHVGILLRAGHPVEKFVVVRPMKADIRRMQAGQYSDSHSNHIYSAR